MLEFKDLFQIIERDLQFDGMFLDAGPDSSFPIPRELFDQAARVVEPPEVV